MIILIWPAYLRLVNRLYKINARAVSVFIFIIFKDEETKNDPEVLNHERIHLWQQFEMLFLFQWLAYLYFKWTRGYRNNPFEEEAHTNDKNLSYLKTRKFWAWTKYV